MYFIDKLKKIEDCGNTKKIFNPISKICIHNSL